MSPRHCDIGNRISFLSESSGRRNVAPLKLHGGSTGLHSVYLEDPGWPRL